MEDRDFLVLLTNEGVVLLHEDAKLLPEEDRYLNHLNKRLIERRKQQWLMDISE